MGTVIVILLLLQPFFGVINHVHFVKAQRRGAWAFLHVWYGRILIIMGIINGGLGLQLAGNTKAGKITYAVLGGVVGAALCIMAIVVESRRILEKGKDEQ